MKRPSQSQGQDSPRASEDCAAVMEVLQNSWLDGPLPMGKATAPAERAAGDRGVEGDRSDRSVLNHLSTCARCRKEARDFHQVSSDLLAGFTALVRVVDLPTREKMDEIIRKAREEPPEAQLLRRLRRPFRVILWAAFYAFTLLACSALAVALYKALKTL